MTDGIFKRNYDYAYARATEIMSTNSETDFEWSVKLIADLGFDVGIASKLKRENSYILEKNHISDYDQNAILYCSNFGPSVILIGSNVIHRNLPEQKTGDVIKFRFESQRKKLVIDLVRIL